MIFLSGKIGTFEASLVNAIFFYIGIFILEVPTGYIADVYGKKVSMSLSMVALFFGCVIFGFANNFWQFGLGELCFALGGALSSGATEAWLVEKLGTEKADQTFAKVGKISSYFNFGYSILGGVLAYYLGYEKTMFVIASFFLAGSLFSVFVLEKDKLHDHQLQGLELLKSANAQVWQLVFARKQFLATTLLMGTICGPVFSFYQLGYQNVGLSVAILGLITSCLFLCVGQGYGLRNQKLFAKLPIFLQENSFKILIGFGFAIMITGLSFGLGWIYILGMAIVEIGYGDWNNYNFIQINKISSDEFRATTNSVYSLFSKLSGAIALGVCGFVAQNYGLNYAFLIFLGTCCLMLFLKTQVKPKNTNHQS